MPQGGDFAGKKKSSLYGRIKKKTAAQIRAAIENLKKARAALKRKYRSVKSKYKAVKTKISDEISDYKLYRSKGESALKALYHAYRWNPTSQKRTASRVKAKIRKASRKAADRALRAAKAKRYTSSRMTSPIRRAADKANRAAKAKRYTSSRRTIPMSRKTARTTRRRGR